MGGGGGGSSEPPEPPLNPPLFIIAVNGVNVALISCTRSFTARTKPQSLASYDGFDAYFNVLGFNL